MTIPRIVFHCADQDLFERFIRGLSRQVLLHPLKNDTAFQTRHFRGYRISGNRPDVASISRAYHKEINGRGNESLVGYLCGEWVLAHETLMASTLARLGIRDFDLRRFDTWLSPAAKVLQEKGCLNAASDLTRSLAFDYPVEDILTIVSILSIDCDPQSPLRQQIEQEFRTVHDDPHALHEVLTKQHRQEVARLEHIEKLLATAATDHAAEIRPINNNLTQLTRRKAKLDTDGSTHDRSLHQRQKDLEEARATYEDAKTKHDKAALLLQDWKTKQTKLSAAIELAQNKLKQLRHTHTARGADLDKRKNLAESEIAEITLRLDAVRPRMLHATASATATAKEQVNDHSSTSALNALTCSFQDLLHFVSRPGFTATPVTLDICAVYLQGRLDAASIPSRPASLVANPEAASLYHAHMAVYGEPSWSRATLSKYALSRSLQAPMETSERRSEFIIGGLYHVERLADPETTELLLTRLVNLLPENTATITERRELSEALDVVEDCPSDMSMMRRLGSLQAKVAIANPNALRDLYNAMRPAIRISAKRALLSQMRHLDLQDTDPTHEVLDLVTTNLETLLGPLTNGLQTWGLRASLQADVRQGRQTLLAATAKLPHVFSQGTNDRLAKFRDLLGAQLTNALSDDTLDGYDLLRRLLLEYCIRECGEPEWISSRYLFPIVMSLGRVASRADREVRKRKPEISVALEKQQHPIGTTRQGVPFRIRLENSGAATAKELHLEVEADNQAVVVSPRDYRLAKLGQGNHMWWEVSMDVIAPVSAVGLSCLLEWKDPSGERHVSEPALKLTAQRVVNWAQARVNPYSLRSITSQDRLVGRDDDLEALRIGIHGAQSFCITGQKRVGKTSVARVLFRDFVDSDSHVAVYLTFGDLTVRSWQILVYSLYEAIDDELIGDHEEARAKLVSVDEFVSNQPRHNRAILKSVERKLNGRRVLCILDDFDEIDENLYKGDNGKELFLRFRTLIDRGDFSFVFVGSEKLPDVFRHQGERLNQVQSRSLNYFRERSSLRGLVVDPALPHLEFSDDAVAAIWTYSAGNPYYATQICSRVYEDMLARKDHYVASGDVLRGIDAICRDSNVNNFQHLWTDGVFESGLDTARLQYLNAAIQAACARCCSVEKDGSVERSVLVKERSLGNYDPAQVGFRLDNLVDRGVLLKDGNRVRLRVPLFERWLLRDGEAAVRSSFSEEDLETRVAPKMAGPSPRAIVEVTRDVSYQGKPLTEDRVRTWLEQFGPAENQELALCLLKRLKLKGYFDEARMHGMSKAVHGMMLTEFANAKEFAQVIEKRRVKNVFVSTFDGEGRSGGRVLHLYRNANSLASQLVGSMEEAVRFVGEQGKRNRSAAVVFVDDFIGTGRSCVEGLQRFVEKMESRKVRREGVVVGVAALVGFRHGVEAVRSNSHLECYVAASEELGPEDRAFAPGVGTFDTENARMAAEKLCQAIGAILEPKQPMGYGGCEALVCFGHRCPNNTLPVFYKDGVMYQGREWIPLFPR